MSNLTQALVIVLAINAVLWLGQVAVLEVNPTGTTFFNADGTTLQSFDSGNYTLNDDDPATVLPSAESSVSPETGNIFTDAFTGIKNWFLESTGLNYVFSVLGAPYRFLKAAGLPSQFTFVLGSMWYGITLFLVIAFMFGRDA